jgi:hypothetical protein
MASSAISSQGTTLQIQTTAGSADTITGVVVGNPTILTSAAHGNANGDVGTFNSGFSGADASLLNGKSVVLTNITTNTFAVQIDTTGKTITAGTANWTPSQWQKVGNLHSFSGFDGQASEIDVTNLDSTGKEYLLGLVDGGNVQIEVDLDNSDLGQAKLLLAYQSGNSKAFKLTLPNGAVASFTAFVKQYPVSLGVDQAVKRGGITLRVTGAVTWA